MLEFGIGPVLQRLDLLGLALYVALAGPGRWSADVERGAAAEPSLRDHARAIVALKWCVGGALLVVAARCSCSSCTAADPQLRAATRRLTPP